MAWKAEVGRSAVHSLLNTSPAIMAARDRREQRPLTGLRVRTAVTPSLMSLGWKTATSWSAGARSPESLYSSG